MIKTKYLASDVKDVSSAWVMERYLKIPVKLEGQDVMIRSVFNGRDRRPSLSLYVTKGKRPQYKFKDHSTDIGGDKIDLVMRSFNLSYGNACEKIISDYNQYVLENGDDNVREFREGLRYTVTGWTRRKWNVIDKAYWPQYEIGSKDLERWYIWPLEYYKLENSEKELIITGNQVYGFFTMSGELYKIYQPMVSERRFLKIKSHIQGWEQLTGKSEVCLILESLKDVVVVSVHSPWEAVAGDNATTLLPQHVIEELKKKYKYVIPCLNNDQAGLSGMEKYKLKYELPGIILPMEKDPSDSVKKYGADKVMKALGELIQIRMT